MANTEGLVKYGMIFILVIVGFSLFAAIYPSASDAGDRLTDEGMCDNAACFFNDSRTGGALGATFCTAANTTSEDNASCTASSYTTGGFPLGSLFAGGGVLFVVLAASILMLYIKKSR